MTYTAGLDVSYYEPKIDWGRVLAQGYTFMFTKATQGTGYVDSRFSQHWPGARNAGVLRGAYHYLAVGMDPLKQADLFLSTLGNDIGELPPVLDLEGKYNETATSKQILGACEVWLGRVQKVTGKTPMIYSAYFFLRDRVCRPTVGGPPPWSMNYPLWIAQYLNHPATEADTPLQPKGWQDWKFWQHSEKGMVAGITGDDNFPTAVDLNYFRGSQADLLAFAGGKLPTPVTPTPPPVTPPPVTPPVTPPAGPTVYTIKAGDNLSVIAARFHTTVDAIVHLNNISNPNMIFVGQVLVIPH